MFQAIIKMDKDGSFYIKNIGKSSMLVNNRELHTDQSQRLLSHHLVEVSLLLNDGNCFFSPDKTILTGLRKYWKMQIFFYWILILIGNVIYYLILQLKGMQLIFEINQSCMKQQQLTRRSTDNFPTFLCECKGPLTQEVLIVRICTHFLIIDEEWPCQYDIAFTGEVFFLEIELHNTFLLHAPLPARIDNSSTQKFCSMAKFIGTQNLKPGAGFYHYL